VRHFLLVVVRHQARCRASLTANMTANIVNVDGRWHMSADSQRLKPIESERSRMLVDTKPAVFKTVCGLREPKGCD
jgi:hypothetical protein